LLLNTFSDGQAREGISQEDAWARLARHGSQLNL
jgi:hypothetical protein